MLDTNVYSRPLDDFNDKKVQLEAESSKKIISLANSKTISIITSEILYYEISLIRDKDKREIIFHIAETIQENVVFIDKKIENLADNIQVFIKDYADCLHIASAGLSKCSYMVTCDKELLRKAMRIERFLFNLGITLHIVDPIKIVKILGENYGI